MKYTDDVRLWAYDLDLWPWRSPWLSVICYTLLVTLSEYKMTLEVMGLVPLMRF